MDGSLAKQKLQNANKTIRDRICRNVKMNKNTSPSKWAHCVRLNPSMRFKISANAAMLICMWKAYIREGDTATEPVQRRRRARQQQCRTALPLQSDTCHIHNYTRTCRPIWVFFGSTNIRPSIAYCVFLLWRVIILFLSGRSEDPTLINNLRWLLSQPKRDEQIMRSFQVASQTEACNHIDMVISVLRCARRPPLMQRP